MEIQDQAYVIHQRPLSDNRHVLELFTRDHGRIAGVVRAGGKGKSKKLLPQQFCLLEAMWYGRSELKNIKTIESSSAPLLFVGEKLFCGLYLNELLIRLLEPEDPHQDIFSAYHVALSRLVACDDSQQFPPVLREFELLGLSALGYGLNFEFDIYGEQIEPRNDRYYRFSPGEGFYPVAEVLDRSVFPGAVVVAMASAEWAKEGVSEAALMVCRAALKPLLGDKPLKSRELYRSLKAQH